MKSANKRNLEVRATTVRTTSTMSYEELVDKIGAEWERGRNNAIRAVNIEYVQTKWRIGRYIVEFEQHGCASAKKKSRLTGISSVECAQCQSLQRADARGACGCL